MRFLLRALCLAAAITGIASGQASEPQTRREKDFLISVTVDFFGDLSTGLYTPEVIDRMMARIKEMGAQRVYWLYYGEIDPRAPVENTLYGAAKYGTASIARIGEPLRAAVPAAHRHGLEIYGVLKPYHTGMATTFPSGSPAANSRTRLGRIGGTLQQVIPFVEQHPEMRIKRRPEDAGASSNDVPVGRLRLLKRDDSPTRIRAENLQLWVSSDNYGYQRLPVQLTIAEGFAFVEQDIRDYYGNLLTPRGSRVRCLDITGLNLTEKFVVITTNFPDLNGDFSNTPVAMLQAYAADGRRLPIVVGTADALWTRPRGFRRYGLEFDSGFGLIPMTLDLRDTAGDVEAKEWKRNRPEEAEEWKSNRPDLGLGTKGGFVAFARGKNEYLPAAVCESYPEVRDLWLGWIKSMLAAGVDGIDLRVSAHGTLTDEPKAYGFNEPVLAVYRQRFGEPPGGSGHDAAKIAGIRGEFYTEFVQAVSALVRGRNKKMQAHLHAEAFRDNPAHGQLMGFPANITFDWRKWIEEGWLDSVTLRTSWFEAGEDPLRGGNASTSRSRLANALEDSVVREMLRLANEKGLPVHLQRYVSRAVGADEYVQDIGQIFGDGRFAGFDVYELFHLARWSDQTSKFESVQGRPEIIEKKISVLRHK